MIRRTQQKGEMSPPTNRKNFDIPPELAVEAAKIAAADRRSKNIRIGKKDVYAHWLMKAIVLYHAGKINPVWQEHGERINQADEGAKAKNRLRIKGGLSVGILIPSGYNDMLNVIHEKVQREVAPGSITQTSIMVCLMQAAANRKQRGNQILLLNFNDHP